MKDMSCNIKINIILFAGGLLGNTLTVILTNILGLHFEIFRDQLLKWNIRTNPFIILSAIAAFNIMRQLRFKNAIVNGISAYSLLIYIIHENLLVRTYFKPYIWHYIYNKFGYEHVIAWVFAVSILICY